MSTRTAIRLAAGLAVLSVVLCVTGEVLSYMASRSGGSDLIVTIEFLAITVVFSAIGTLIVSRQPQNAIGWLLCGAGLSAALAEFSHGYADHWLDTGAGSDLVAKTAALYGSLSWMPLVLPCATFLLLLFPDGRLLSRRWRPVAWCAGIGIAVSFVGSGLIPGPLEDYPTITNPYGVKALNEPLQGLSALLLLVALVGSPASLILRFRRSPTEQRQQIKWLALAGAVAAITIVVGISVYDTVGEAIPNVAILLSVLGLPVAAGIAILRHRLYDIDVVINRALVYGALTATLAATYLGSVLLLQLALSGLTAGSSLAVAVSTLAVAALFRPARGRIQGAVDRRFFRSKYDAAQTLEAFGTRLRDEVDLEAVGTELRAAVRETVQPTHLTLWLQTDRRTR